MTAQLIDIPLGKQREFFGGPFGVNRTLGKRHKLPVDTEVAYDALGLYFSWANSLANEQDREQALREGEFALRDLQTQGFTEVREGTPDYEHYDGLRKRKGRIDTIEIRRRVFGQVTKLVVEFLDNNDPARNISRE